MASRKRTHFHGSVALSVSLALCGQAATAAPFSIAGHTRPFAASDRDLGPAESSRTLHVRLWLKPQNTSELTSLVADQKDRNSVSYHRWLSKLEELRPFKAASRSAEQVRHYLLSKGAKDVEVDSSGNYVSASIKVADAEKIFQVKLHRYLVRGKSVIANESDPRLESEVADKVAYIGGLTTHKKIPMIARQRDLNGGFLDPVPFTAGVQFGTHEANCFRAVETHSFSTTGTNAVQASYTGNRYGSDANATAPNLPPCGYSPADIQQAYGVTDLVKAGLDGTGQTIVIIDAYGSPTIQADAAAFSTANGLPAPSITVYTPGGTPVTGPWTDDEQGWAGETTLDVEWAHVVAPGAKIALVEAMTANDDDLTAAMAYAVENNLGNVISNSWAGPESEEDAASMSLFDLVLQTAAAKGIAVNFSSGDNGDEVSDGNGGGLGYVDVNYPTSSALVTGVGGTSLALNADRTVKFQVGWGNNGMRIADSVTTADQAVAGQNPALDPPTKLGFIGGAGGGTSRITPKPEFQGKLPGSFRMVPDIAFLADPYTGVEVVESSFDSKGNPQPGSLTVQTIGGTSLACPMFSALWAIAIQAHGSSLGQAAPLLYSLPEEAINDIVPLSSPNNVTGSITDSKGTNALNALALGLPETFAPFYSALYNSPKSPFRWNVLTFGTDSTLETAVGWDNVTGLGVPNGLQFIRQFMTH